MSDMQQNTGYPPPPQHNYYINQQVQEIPTVGNYIIVQLLAMIPIAGFILMIIWAVGGAGTPLWKANYARAYFLMLLICVVLSVVFSVVFAGALTALLGDIYY